MIRVTLDDCTGIKVGFDPFLEYVTDKMAGQRSDAHDTATQAYVIGRKIRDRGVAAGSGPIEVPVSNEFARAACRELQMYVSFTKERGNIASNLIVEVWRQLDANLRRQDAAKWSREREKVNRNRPTVREANAS